MIGECCSSISHNAITYLNCWRRMRRAAHEALKKTAVQNYQPIQMKEATILV